MERDPATDSLLVSRETMEPQITRQPALACAAKHNNTTTILETQQSAVETARAQLQAATLADI
jgi:hypothetical protein